MSKAIVFIRQSYSTDSDSASLEMQREEVPALADDLDVDHYDTVDLGRHTGFSIHTKDEDEERIDSNEEVLEAVSRIRDGEYDYILAYDDTRISRDEYFWEVKRAAEYGDAEFEFVEDVPDLQSMEFAVHRTVEQKVKEREMKKSKKARERREENGYDFGRPKFGTEYDESGEYLVPNEKFEEVVTALRMRDNGATYSDIVDETENLGKTTLSKLFNERLDFYLRLCEEHEFDVPQLEN